MLLLLETEVLSVVREANMNSGIDYHHLPGNSNTNPGENLLYSILNVNEHGCLYYMCKKGTYDHFHL